VGFRWLTGWRLQRGPYQDKGSESNNSRSLEFHIDGKVDKIAVNRSFCMKEVTRNDLNYKRPTWPQGKYCIYKGSDRFCPKGLTFGWVFWSDNYNNDDYDGYVPDGTRSQLTFTQINFCCRTDGDKDEPILLPTQSPFFLLAYESAKCQMVKWAVASLEWIYYSTSGLKDDQRNGSYPYNGGTMHPTIYYCYYQGEKQVYQFQPLHQLKFPNIRERLVSKITGKITSS